MNFYKCGEIINAVSHVIVGKQDAIELLLVALLGGGHALIEDVPGVGKTLLARALAKSIGGQFARVQFTPDLLPADITGFNVFNQRIGQFEFKSGPVMTHILLADEINRTVPRTQASLLESMAERQVTVDGLTHKLPRPFFVVATQNPIELEGTFPLPEAQLDRFLLKIRMGYPDEEEETRIMERFQSRDPMEELEAVTDPQEIGNLQRLCRKVRVSQPVKKYIADLVAATRVDERVRFGSSPRGSLGLMYAAQALAAVQGRDYVLPDDIKFLAEPVLAHRVILTDEEKLRGSTAAEVIATIIDTLPLPDLEEP